MLLGYTSIAVTLMIWASFFLSLKGGANSVLAPCGYRNDSISHPVTRSFSSRIQSSPRNCISTKNLPD